METPRVLAVLLDVNQACGGSKTSQRQRNEDKAVCCNCSSGLTPPSALWMLQRQNRRRDIKRNCDSRGEECEETKVARETCGVGGLHVDSIGASR